jgi:hypothetical protein
MIGHPDLQKNRSPPSPLPPAPQKNRSNRSISKLVGATLQVPVFRPAFPLDFQTRRGGQSDRFQNRSVRPISEMIGATLHARGSKVTPLPPTPRTTKKSIGPIKFKIGRGDPVAGQKNDHVCCRALPKEIVSCSGNPGKQPIPHQGHSRYKSLAQRGPDEAPERPPKGVGSLIKYLKKNSLRY